MSSSARPDPPWLLDENAARSPSIRLARFVSFAGQPAIIVAIVTTILVLRVDGPPSARWTALGIIIFLILVSLAYSALQVRRGHWRDMDASDVRERRKLNRFAIAIMLAASVGTYLTGQPAALTAGLLFSTLMVSLAHLLRRWLKVSLHSGVAAFASALLWPQIWLVAGLGGLAVLIAWSRLKLKRHTRAEVISGLCIGAGTGALYSLYLPNLESVL